MVEQEEIRSLIRLLTHGLYARRHRQHWLDLSLLAGLLQQPIHTLRLWLRAQIIGHTLTKLVTGDGWSAAQPATREIGNSARPLQIDHITPAIALIRDVPILRHHI